MSYPKYSSGLSKDSFAYLTLTVRVPEMISNLVDSLSVKNNFNENELLKNTINKLTELRYSILTNKNLTELTSDHSVNVKWNGLIKMKQSLNSEMNPNPSWLSVCFLFSECLAYRKIYDIFYDTYRDTMVDYFHDNKVKSLVNSQKLWMEMIHFSESSDKTTPKILNEQSFRIYLQACLWGNQWDLSLSAGKELDLAGCNSKFLNVNSIGQSDININNNDYLLVDHSDKIYSLINEIKNMLSNDKTIDFVLDNVGFELFSDMNLALYLLDCSVCNIVNLHFKNIPWFVSDALPTDLDEMLQYFESIDDPLMMNWCSRVRSYIKCGNIRILINGFWTSPLGFNEMLTDKLFDGHDLFNILNNSCMVFFKGDLNYRKLVDDREWPIDTPLNIAIRQFFNLKCPLAFIRILKSEICVGLTNELKDRAQNMNEKWMVNGKFAVIQCSTE